jgi:microcystin degradation protein MlrC
MASHTCFDALPELPDNRLTNRTILEERMRFAIGGFAHETNTFCPGVTELDAFKRHWAEADDLFTAHRGVRTDIGGMIAAAERLGIELVPALATSTEPSATIARDTFDTITSTMLGYIKAALPVDAVVLGVHGAGSAEGIDDIEGAFLGMVRELIGPDVPLVVTLDLHGNTTQAMVDAADLLLYCHEYPHIDMFERGEEAVDLAAKLVNGSINPVMHFRHLPIMFAPSSTFVGPAKLINERCFEWERQPGVIDCNFTHGFPHTDVSVIATTILVTTDGDPDLAKRAADDVTGLFIENLDGFLQSLPNADQAIAEALAATELPVVVAEVSDNPGGGAPGDGTHLLRALLNANEPRTAFGFIWDPQTAALSHKAGVGSQIRVALGGFWDDLHGAPIEADAYVKSLTDGRFVLTNPMGAGATVDLGPCARLVIGNVDVIVSSMRTQTLDPGPFLLHGIDVTTYRVLAIKSQQHFRGGFTNLAGTIIRADTPGLTTVNLDNLPYKRITRPIWPLDPLSI